MTLGGKVKRSLVFCFILLVFPAFLPASLHAENDNIKFKGDFRFRHEIIDREDSNSRTRERFRARFALEAKVNDQIRAIIEFATGGSDPVSNNQTLGDGFSTKPIGIQLAYAVWQPKQVKGLALMAGKTINPYLRVQKSELLWDPDLSMEGLAGQYVHDVNEFGLFANGGIFITKERSQQKNSYFVGGQGGISIDFNDVPGYLLVGGGYIDYVNIKGFQPFYDPENSSGNSVDALGNYLFDFNELDFFAETGTVFHGYPMALFGHFVDNIAADSNNIGWLVGLSIGKVKEIGSWFFRYQYKYLEKDAVVGQFTDSDFIGGGTNGKGHEFNFAIQAMKATTFDLTLFLNKATLETEKDYTRFQGDVQFKF
jgi:hypothetical protein